MISFTAEYALRATVHLARHSEGACTAREIAETTKCPPGYVSKVLNDLVRAGLVVSQRGPNGGFTLSREASQISLLQVINAVDPIERIHACPLGLPSHGKRLCMLHRRIDAAIAMIEDAFGTTKLSDLIESGDAEACPADGRAGCDSHQRPTNAEHPEVSSPPSGPEPASLQVRSERGTVALTIARAPGAAS